MALSLFVETIVPKIGARESDGRNQVPTGLITLMVEETASQGGRSQGHLSRARQRPARLNDHEVVMPRRQPQEGSLPEHVREEYARPGKPSGISRAKDIGSDHRHYLRLCITTAWQKLNEYYIKLGESPLFSAAIILHPALGTRYLEMNWETEEQLVWVRDAKAGLSRYFERWYRGSRPQGAYNQRLTKATKKSATTEKPHEDSEFRQWVKSRTARTTATGSELDRYLRLEPQETDDPVDWWMAHQGTFPLLSQLALDILAIPAMATDCERSFSLAKLSLTSQRLSMGPTTLEALQCLKN